MKNRFSKTGIVKTGIVKTRFVNQTRVPIHDRAPNVIRSTIDVAGIEGPLTDVNVTIDVDHSFTSDLVITLISPHARIVLAQEEGDDRNDFRATLFDDEAQTSIEEGTPPFTGSFRPRESLEVLKGQDPNGRWELEIEDVEFRDGGELRHWALEIEHAAPSEEHEILAFHNSHPRTIHPGEPNVLLSTIHVTGHAGRLVRDLSVDVDISHSFVRDLTLTLINPDGARVVLAKFAGGGGNDFQQTVFADSGETRIGKGEAPFTGIFQPEEALASLANRPLTGAWGLEVNDKESGDGGSLNSWGLRIKTDKLPPIPHSQFHIDVVFLGGLSSTQRAVFEDAATRWSEIIVGDLESVEVDGNVIDDIVIGAEGVPIDGAGSGQGNILGQAGPTRVRTEGRHSGLPYAGIMSFDTYDLDQMEDDGSLLDVIIHEMGHVLGIGTLWEREGLLKDPVDGIGVEDPKFIGEHAVGEYGKLSRSEPSSVPVEDEGGEGTRNGHWRERTFGRELMTGWVERGHNPISRLTIGSLEDMGYTVDYGAADTYGLLNVSLRERARRVGRACCTGGFRIDPATGRALVRSNLQSEDVKVGEKIHWKLGFSTDGGVTMGEAGQSEVEMVSTIKAEFPAQGDPVEWDVQLDDVAKLEMLLVSSTNYGGEVEVKGDGDAVALKGPLLLYGAMIERFSSSLAKLTVHNKSTDTAKIKVMIGRKLS